MVATRNYDMLNTGTVDLLVKCNMHLGLYIATVEEVSGSSDADPPTYFSHTKVGGSSSTKG